MEKLFLYVELDGLYNTEQIMITDIEIPEKDLSRDLQLVKSGSNCSFMKTITEAVIFLDDNNCSEIWYNCTEDSYILTKKDIMFFVPELFI